jgi:6,7-dimethyl-8-ribityllumazine synthase
MSGGDGANRLDANLEGEGMVIGVVVSRFNEPVVEALLDGCWNELLELGVRAEDITVASVPGALEIPLALQKLAETDRFDALVALGAVIRGETYHFEVVSDQSAAGIQRVQLDTGVPVANGVLTTNTDEQAEARLDKGAEAARVAIEMANLLQAIDDE